MPNFDGARASTLQEARIPSANLNCFDAPSRSKLGNDEKKSLAAA
jgi:hypothetical protein